VRVRTVPEEARSHQDRKRVHLLGFPLAFKSEARTMTRVNLVPLVIAVVAVEDKHFAPIPVTVVHRNLDVRVAQVHRLSLAPREKKPRKLPRNLVAVLKPLENWLH